MDRVHNEMLSRWGWVVVLTVLAVAGVVFRWHWLVALGLASIVLSVVPCLIMCALGLCAYRVQGRSRCEKPLQVAEATDTAPSDRSGAARVVSANSRARPSAPAGCSQGKRPPFGNTGRIFQPSTPSKLVIWNAASKSVSGWANLCQNPFSLRCWVKSV